MQNLPAKALFYCLGWVAFVWTFGSVSIHAQSPEDFPVPESYQVEGIPPIKKSQVNHLFFEPSEIKSNLIWDVDIKNRSVFVTDERSFVYKVVTPLAKPSILIEGRVPNTVRVNPIDSTIAITDDKDDQDNFELYLWSDKSPLRKLSSFSGKDESVESVIWDREGKTLFYTQADYDLKTSKLCRHDLSSSKCFPVKLKGIWNVIDSSKNSLLLKYWKASSSQSIYIYDVTTGKLSPVTEQGNATKGFFVGNRVLWLWEGAAECGIDPCLMSLDLKTGTRKKLALPKDTGNVGDIKASPDGKLLMIQESRDGLDNLSIGRLKGNSIEKIASRLINSSYVIWNTRWLSNNEVIYTIENIGMPARIESFDLASSKSTSWTTSLLPEQLRNKVRAPQVIEWKSFDAMEISGYVVKPEMIKKKSPVLVFIHGGPQITDRPTFNFQDLRFSAYLGLTIIHTNIRGSKGFGTEFMDADNGPKRGNAVADISALLDWISKQPDLDSDNVFLRGESYGGFVALSAALKNSQRLKGVIAEYPMVSIRGYLSQSWIDEFAISEYGDPKDEALMKKLDELSPLNNALRWKGTPLFLTRGKLDSRVPEGDVLGLKSQLQDAGTEVWFIYDNEAGHGVDGRYVTAAMYDFLKTHIKEKTK